MKKLIWTVIVLAIVGGGGYWYYTYSKVEVKPQITELAVGKGPVSEIVQATGTLDSLRTVNVGTQVTGVVKKLYHDYNDIVKQGELLAELDPTLLQSQVDMQEANLQRADVDINQRQITMENDQKKLERQRELFAKQLVTKEQLEAAELQVKVDQAQLDSSRASRSQTLQSLNQAKTNLGYTKITAPIDGVITVRAADEGSTVNASTSAPTLYTMATDLTHMKLTAAIDEAEVSKVREGQNVTFRVDAYATQMFRGTVNQVRLNAKNSQNVITYETVIDVMNPDFRLKPGMTATLQIEVQHVDDTLTVPAAALRFRPTAEMFELLKQPVPPEAQQQNRGAGGPGAGGGNNANGGGRGNRNGRNNNGNGPAVPFETTPASGATAQGGQANAALGGNSGRGQGGGGRGQGGFGGGRFQLTPDQQKKVDAISNNTKLTDDQKRAERMKLYQSFGLGGGRGGNNGGRNGRGTQSAGDSMTSRGASTIDALLPAVVARPLPNQRVWVFQNNQLKPISGLTTGITNGQVTQLISGDLKEGDKVVTNFVIPGAKPTAPTQQQGNPFQQQGGRGPGGGGRGGF